MHIHLQLFFRVVNEQSERPLVCEYRIIYYYLELPPTNCFVKNTKHALDKITPDSYQDKKIEEVVQVGSTSVSKEFI